MTTNETEAAVTGEPIFSIRDATVTFDMSRGQSRVLDAVDLDVVRDEVIGVVGESGSGKSMLANAMLDAVVDPGRLSGSVTYRPPDGEPVDVLDLDDEELRRLRWEEIAMVFQGAMGSFNPTMKIRGHFEETLDAHDRDVEAGMERARRLLSDLYLEPDRVLDSYAHELSGGMSQRALIALSLVLEPEVLIMDEPTAALDLLMQRSIIDLLEDLKEEYDLTLVFITHDLPLVAHLADRLYVMYAFEIAEFGETDDILENPTHPYTRLLLQSTPNLDTSIEAMSPIEGSAPDPVAVPEGCSFHPRCPLSTDRCKSSDPSFQAVGDAHRSACWHWEDAAEAVPFTDQADREPPAQVGGGRTKSAGDPLVELDDVSVSFELESGLTDLFSEPETVTAVDGVSLAIPENDVVAVVGESGCGKTTLGKTVLGLHRPSGGSVRYRDQDVWDARDGSGDVEIPFEEIRRDLQIIHQDPGSALNPNKRVLDTLGKPLKKWHSMSRNERESRIYTMLETVGMEPARDYAQRFPHQLSGGEKQRVALVRALLMNPALILADEAISALDVSLRVEMMDLMLELQDTFDTSFLFISHDLSNARYLAEKADGRIAVMYLGEIVEIGPVEQIIHDPQHPYTQTLRWATPDLHREETGDSPLRNIDIPDPVNPPSGCRFHTRCPEARETCRSETPAAFDAGDGREVSCFRVEPDHEYWESEPIGEPPAEGPRPAQDD